MLQDVSVSPLSEPWLLQILYKVSPMTQCRLRRTCKTMDEFMEAHRFRIAKHSRNDLTLNVQFKNGSYNLHATPSWTSCQITFVDPFKQLSGIYFDTINLSSFTNSVAPLDARLELSDLLSTMKLHCRLFCCHRSRNTDELLEFLEHISPEELNFSLAWKVLLQALFSNPVFKIIDKLTLHFQPNGQLKFPDNGLLDHLKQLSSISVDFTDIGNSRHNQFVELFLKMICHSDDTGNLGYVQFRIEGNIDVWWISKGLKPILGYKIPNLETKVLFQNLPSCFLTVETKKTKDSFRYTDYEEITVTFHKKNDMDELRRSLITTAGELGDIAFNNIMKTLNS